ncbi:MAG: serine/threonine-protein kinase [Candidatus Hydrogenedentes bacterium]|nr:serine/threonine-protein kinase [Candidatus Hydrogenedentota bacterium]
MDNTAPVVSAQTGQASLLGTSLGGYVVRALIGRGAVGTVYLARDTALNRPVALKVLLGSLARNPSMVRSFHREAQAAAPLRHPCIVRVYSAGIESGTPYIAMEYVPGEPLDRFLRRKGQVTWQTALYVGAQVAQALDCAHSNGVIHRDVKPANILLDTQGRVRLADFGIARAAARGGNSTGGNGVIGTPAYMAPEQCEGSTVSVATDLYALGVVLYQMMAGQVPFKAESPQAVVKQILTDEAPRLNKMVPGIPDDVARLVAHLLEKEPEARPRSAYEVLRTIDRLHKEDGGRSAIPEALAAFVREQAMESSLRLVTPPPANAARAGRSVPRFPGKNVGIWAAASMLAVVAMLALALGRAGEGKIPQAPRIAEARFIDTGEGAVLAQIPARGFEVAAICWAGPVLVVEARGRSGTLVDGASGCLTLNPFSKTCASPIAPQPWQSHSPSAPHAVPLEMTYRIPSTDREGPLSNAVLLSTHNNGKSVLTAQRVDDALPWTAAVVEIPPQMSRVSREWAADSPRVAVHPNGSLLCVCIANPDGTSGLMEYDLIGDSSPRGRALTPEGIHVCPLSVQYDPAGERIAYQRVNATGARELWIASRNAVGGPGILLASGPLAESYAFSPDGTRVAVPVGGAGQEAPELHIIDTKTGELLARPCHGIVGPESWHPVMDLVVATEEDSNGTASVWAVRTAPPFTVTLLDGLGPALRGPVSISPDGQWLAIVSEREGGPAIAFHPFVPATPAIASSACAPQEEEPHHA